MVGWLVGRFTGGALEERRCFGVDDVKITNRNDVLLGKVLIRVFDAEVRESLVGLIFFVHHRFFESE